MIFTGLLIFLIMDYVRPSSYFPVLMTLRLNFLIFWSVMLGSLYVAGRVTNSDLLRHPNTRMLFCLIGMATMSVLTADLTFNAFMVVRTVTEYTLVYWAISKHVTDKVKMKRILNTLVLVHVVVAALTPEIFTHLAERQYIASGGFLGDSNDFALSVNVVIPLCLYLLLDSTRVFARAFYAAVLLFLVFTVMATQSRGGTVALGCVGIYYWFKSDKKILTGALTMAAIVLILLMAPAAWYARMDNIANPDEGSAQGRILAWKAGWKMALDHPLLGVGAGHFPVKYGAEYRTENVPWANAHSVYFLALGEFGFPGITLLLSILIWNFVANRGAAKAVARPPGVNTQSDLRLLSSLSASLVAFASGGAFLSVLYYPHMFIITGLMAAGRGIALDRHVAPTALTGRESKPLSLHPAMRNLAMRRPA